MPSPSSSPTLNADGIAVEALAGQLANDDELKIQLSHRLHKEVAGGMVACTSLSEMLRHSLGQAEAASPAAKLHSELDSALRQTLGVVRDITEGLYPPVLKVFGFHAALQQLVRSFTEAFGGSIMLQLNGNEPAFELGSRLNLFRLVETMLHIVIEHSNASWLEITCQCGEHECEVSIEHDGGSSVWSAPDTSSQVMQIEARCGLLQARFEVSASGHADRTRCTLLAPLPSADQLGAGALKLL